MRNYQILLSSSCQSDRISQQGRALCAHHERVRSCSINLRKSHPANFIKAYSPPQRNQSRKNNRSDGIPWARKRLPSSIVKKSRRACRTRQQINAEYSNNYGGEGEEPELTNLKVCSLSRISPFQFNRPLWRNEKLQRFPTRENDRPVSHPRNRYLPAQRLNPSASA